MNRNDVIDIIRGHLFEWGTKEEADLLLKDLEKVGVVSLDLEVDSES